MLNFIENFDKEKLTSFLKRKEVRFIMQRINFFFWVILLSYFLSSISISFITSTLLSLATPSFKNTSLETNLVDKSKDFNYKTASNSILDRNLFNKSGSLPEENQMDAGVFSTFDPKAPCAPNTLGLSLAGVIYSGPRTSIASIQDDEYKDTQYYKVGDSILDKEGASIYSISEDIVVINNKGNKECLMNVVKNVDTIFRQMDITNILPKEYEDALTGSGGVQSPCGLVSLSENFVSSELGVGFSNILNRAKVIPNITESGMIGFKLLGIVPGSLFDRICLKDGDIVTQVNDISLLDPDKGFAFYEVFQKEREIQIQIIRDNTPMVINIKQTKD